MTSRTFQTMYAKAVLFGIAIGSLGSAFASPLPNTHCNAAQMAIRKSAPDKTQHRGENDRTTLSDKQSRLLPTKGKHAVLRRQQVYVGTNRLQAESDKGKLSFGTANGPLRYLQGTVAVGTKYQKGELTDITIESLKTLENARMLPDLRPLHTDRKDNRILVFVHGFYVEFEESIRRATQIAHELDYRGALFVFTWPSVFQMTPKGYLADIQVVDRSAAVFLKFLNDLTSRYQKSDIQVLAHSLGCRLLCKAIAPAPSRTAGTKRAVRWPRLSQVVFAAPDVTTSRFETLYSSRLQSVSKRIAIYHSQNDSLLRLGIQYSGGGVRLGLTGPKRKPESTVESIDYARLDGGFGGFGYHNLYRHHPAMIKDIRAVLRSNISPSNRSLRPSSPTAGKARTTSE